MDSESTQPTFVGGEVLAGKYRVERLIGQGGMGIVLAAEHLALNQRVAIKLLRTAALGHTDVVGRFMREARAAVRLRSEHVARVLDVGYVYWTGRSVGLNRAQVDGGNAETAGPLTSLESSFVTVDGDGFFWSFKDDATKAGNVLGAKHANTADRIEYTKQGGAPMGIAADAQYVYWSDRGTTNANGAVGDGRLLACPRGGCDGSGPMVLATGLVGGGRIVLDAQAIYFVENNDFQGIGRIRKVAKP